MYRIVINNKTVYAPTLANAGFVVFAPKVSKEVNAVDSLEFTIPETNPSYSDVKPLEGIVTAYDGENIIFRGRVMEATRNLYRQKTVRCEGDIGVLNDVILRPYTFKGTASDYLQGIIDHYAAVSTYSVQILRGTVTVDGGTIQRGNINYPNCLAEIQDKLLGSSLGGYLLSRYESGKTYIDYLSALTATGDQVIRFGQNLLDLSDYINGAETYTRILPLGASDDEIPDPSEYPNGWNAAQGKRLTIKTVNSGNDYLEASTNYGKIERAVIWDDVSVASNLKTKATSELDDAKNLVHSVTISALDLSLLGVDVAALELGKLYRVVSPAHGFTSTGSMFPLMRMEIIMENPSLSVYEFGRVQKTLTGGY